MAEKEYIERESTYNHMLTTMCGTGYQSRALDVIAFAPAADVVPVVRCKDCKYNNTSSCPTFVECDDGKDFQILENNDFCSCGERME